MPNSDGSISFSPVGPEHYGLLGTWLSRPHVRKWWGDPEEELEYIRAMVEGRDTTRPFILELDGKPIGYIQYWFVSDNRSPELVAESPWLMEVPENAVGVDISIGEEELISKGIGSRAVTEMVRYLRKHGHTAIIIDPESDNLRAIRAYEKAGFHPIPHLKGRTKDVLLMQHHLKDEI